VPQAWSQLLVDLSDRTTLTAQVSTALAGLCQPRAAHDSGRVLLDPAGAATFKHTFGYHPVRREALLIRAEVRGHRRRLVAAGR
jgi:hypothetical protein